MFFKFIQLIILFSDGEQARVAWEIYERREKSLISGNCIDFCEENLCDNAYFLILFIFFN